MDVSTLPRVWPLGLTDWDLIALAWFFVCTVAYNVVTGQGPMARHSLIGAIQTQRFRWFANMARRGDRVVDILLVSNLAAGNSFFASTSIIMLGVLASLLGSGARAQAILDKLPFAVPAAPGLWDMKIVLLITIFVYAFFKFAWAFRLGHYSMIMVGATPFSTHEPNADCADAAERAAKLAGIAAEHSNLGLRAYYFAMAALGWFFSPLIFIITTTIVMLIITRREYFSRSLAIISNEKTRTISTLGL
jgi:uncharacterized membrane protein